MASQPTPEEAADALREVSDRRKQANDLDSHPKWALWGLAVLAIVVGVATDLYPEMSTPLLYVLAAAGLLLGYLPRLKRFGSAMGYRRLPASRPVGIPPRARALNVVLLLAMMVLVLVASRMLRSWEVPYPATIFSVVIVATMPLWHRLLNRPLREPKGAERG